MAFTSRANNLVTNDHNRPWSDVFVRDPVSERTSLVSVDLSGTGGGDADSYGPLISADGQRVLFQSLASNLVSNDVPGTLDLFIRDLSAGTTTRINPGNPSGRAHSPQWTPDGRFISYVRSEVAYLADVGSGQSFQVSRGAITFAESPPVSTNGEWVAFSSSNQEPELNRPDSEGEIHVWNRSTQTATWASSNVYQLPKLPGELIKCSFPALSEDGRSLSFPAITIAPSHTPLLTNLYHHDLITSTTTLVRSNMTGELLTQISADGRFVTFGSGNNIYRWDRDAETTATVSITTEGSDLTHGECLNPVATSDASRVAFVSNATTLVPDAATQEYRLYVRDMSTAQTHLVSRRLDGSPAHVSSSTIPDLDETSQTIAFATPDPRMVENDRNLSMDVVVGDLVGGNVVLVSARHPSLPAATHPIGILPDRYSASADGRMILFSVGSSPLLGGNDNGTSGLIVKDTQTGESYSVLGEQATLAGVSAKFGCLSGNGNFVAYVRVDRTRDPPDLQVYRFDFASRSNQLISVNLSVTNPASGQSYAPSINRDGSKVAFHSNAPDLTQPDLNFDEDVFLWEDQVGITLISRSRSRDASGNGPSINPVISQDGQLIVFQSMATDLSLQFHSGSYYQAFARDLRTLQTTLISAGASGVGFANNSGQFVLNPSGTIAFYVAGTQFIRIHDLRAGTNSFVGSGYHPSMVPDGSVLLLERLDEEGVHQILLVEPGRALAAFVSRNPATGILGNASSRYPIITYNGRYIVFSSSATNLVENDDNGRMDLFVYDRALDAMLLATPDQHANRPGDSASVRPVLGQDGRTVLFTSFASDLVADDYNHARDLFLMKLGSEDYDGDQIDDDWEYAYFGGVERDGHGDFDGDGDSDLKEFRAGTDPTNQNSVFRVIRIFSAGGGIKLLWNAVPGRTYRIESRDEVGDGQWVSRSDLLTPAQPTGVWIDQESPLGGHGQRFYRVRLVDSPL